jgi:hypothetical protein
MQPGQDIKRLANASSTATENTTQPGFVKGSPETKKGLIMTTKKLNIAIAFCIAGLGFASSASASPSTWTYQVRGNGAYANAFTGDECRWVSFDVGANDDVVHSGSGAPTTGAGAWAGYWSYDWCKGVESYGYAYVSGSNFSGNLSSASGSFSFPVYTYGWIQTPEGYWDYVLLGTDTLTASVTWTGVGVTQRGMESYSTRWGQYMARFRWMGSSREADVSVTATLGGVTKSFDYTYGSMGQYNSGGTEIYQY